MQKCIVDLAENDERGDPSGKVYQIGLSVPNQHYYCLLLEHPKGRRIKNIRNKRGFCVEIEKVRFPYMQSIHWFGSMTWNRYFMPTGVWLHLVNHLAASRKWNMLEGKAEIAEIYDRRQEIKASDLGLSESPYISPNQLSLF